MRTDFHSISGTDRRLPLLTVSFLPETQFFRLSGLKDVQSFSRRSSELAIFASSSTSREFRAWLQVMTNSLTVVATNRSTRTIQMKRQLHFDPGIGYSSYYTTRVFPQMAVV